MKIFLFPIGFLVAASAFSQDLKTYEQTLAGTPIKFKMVGIPGGSFSLGSTTSDKLKDEDEGPQKKVTLSPFWIGEREVTFAEWDLFFKNLEVPQT